MDNDILPHPTTPLESLLSVPEGKIGMVAHTTDPVRAKTFYKKALNVRDDELLNVNSVLNSGVFAWRTTNAEDIAALFSDLYLNGTESMAEQNCLAYAIQSRGMHHNLPKTYNTLFYKALFKPLRDPRIRTAVSQLFFGKWMIDWDNCRAIESCIKQPCFVHFAGSHFHKQLREIAERTPL